MGTYNILKLLSSLISVYTLLCFLRVILTWFPSLTYSAFGRFLSAVCDPYMNIFRRLKFLRFSMLDFSPALAICVLVAASSVLGNIAMTGHFSLLSFIATLLSMAWSLVSSFLGFFAAVIGIRLLLLLIRKDYNAIVQQLDYSIQPIIFKIASPFSGHRPISYKSALVVALITIIFIIIAGRYLIGLLCAILMGVKM